MDLFGRRKRREERIARTASLSMIDIAEQVELVLFPQMRGIENQTMAPVGNCRVMLGGTIDEEAAFGLQRAPNQYHVEPDFVGVYSVTAELSLYGVLNSDTVISLRYARGIGGRENTYRAIKLETHADTDVITCYDFVPKEAVHRLLRKVIPEERRPDDLGDIATAIAKKIDAEFDDKYKNAALGSVQDAQKLYLQAIDEWYQRGGKERHVMSIEARVYRYNIIEGKAELVTDTTSAEPVRQAV